MAQRVVPRVRRLHGDRAIPKRNRATVRCLTERRLDRHHVRGSSLVALPSLAARRLPKSARGGSATHSRPKQSRGASLHIGGANCEQRIKLRSRFASVAAVCDRRTLRTLLLGAHRAPLQFLPIAMCDVRRDSGSLRFTLAHAFCQPLEPFPPCVALIALPLSGGVRQ